MCKEPSTPRQASHSTTRKTTTFDILASARLMRSAYISQGSLKPSVTKHLELFRSPTIDHNLNTRVPAARLTVDGPSGSGLNRNVEKTELEVFLEISESMCHLQVRPKTSSEEPDQCSFNYSTVPPTGSRDTSVFAGIFFPEVRGVRTPELL